MATSISTLSYRIVADTSNFTKGISATRKELSTQRQMMQAMETPAQKYQKSIEGINKMSEKFNWTADQKAMAMKEVNSEYKSQTDASGKLGKALGPLGTTILGVIGTYGSFQQAIAFVNKELDEQIRLQKEATATQVAAGAAQASMMANLPGGISQKDARKFQLQIENIAQTSGIPFPVAHQAAGGVLSATQGDLEKTKSILGASFDIFSHDPGQIPEFSGAMADVTRMMGSGGKKDVMKAASIVVSGMGQARITELSKMSEAVKASAAATITDTSGDLVNATKESFAAFAAAGLSGADPLGRETKTAVAKMFVELAKVFPEGDTTNMVRGKKVTTKGTGMKTFGERLMAAQQRSAVDPAFRGQMLKLPLGESTLKTVLGQLITDEGSLAAQAYVTALPNISTDPENTRRLIARMTTTTPEQALGTFTRGVASIKESSQLAMGPSGAIRTALQTLLEQAGLGFGDATRRSAIMKQYDIDVAGGGAPFDVAKGVLKRREDELTGAAERRRMSMVPFAGNIRREPLTEEQKQNLSEIKKGNELLEKLNKTLEIIAERDESTEEVTIQ